MLFGKSNLHSQFLYHRWRISSWFSTALTNAETQKVFKTLV